MNIFKSNFIIIPLVALLILSSCSKMEDVNPANDQSTGLPDVGNDAENIPQWIHDEMDFFYYWNADMDPKNPTGDEDPFSYFNGLLNTSDKFSYITDDAEAIKEEKSGTILAMGFASSYGVFTNSDNLFAVVEYVYAGSPADVAGLKRGDIILKIDGEDLTDKNYLDLNSENGFSVTLGKFNGSFILPTQNIVKINTGTIELNPVIHYEVKNVDQQKVGYLVFVEFISGENDKWLTSLGNAFSEMKSEGVSQMIVDLRYNPGGEVKVAQYLASALAPASVVSNQDILAKYDYNENLQKYYAESQGENSVNLSVKFSNNVNNLNLNSIIFLTAGGTASASELVINGLKPYMNVTVIGEPTYGKYYGSYLLYDQNAPPAHNWAIAPIVLKYANANGVTDFVNGLSPDLFIQDDLLNAKSFGDESDLMLAAAISFIKGGVLSASSGRLGVSRLYTPVYDVNKINRKNVFLTIENR